MRRSCLLCRKSRVEAAVVLLLAFACLTTPRVAAADPVAAAESPTVAESLVREAADYGWRHWVRKRVVRPEDEQRFGLKFDDNWQACDAKLPVVVLVHGFNSTCERNMAVLAPVREAGYPCAGFSYPNDQSLGESAIRLSTALRTFAAANPQRRLVLVTHSMGGLVARAVVEDPCLDPENVDRLIQIAPPNQGTLLAHVAVATDVWEHWLGRAAGGAWTRWRDSVVDGLGEAADDLAPGSPFLEQLNAHPRNPRVKYTVLLGTTASMTEGEMAWFRTALEKTGGRMPGLRTAATRLNSLLDDMDELVDGKGDGVVAVKRGRLDGVDDVVVIPFGHLTCTGCDCEDGSAVQREVLARIR